MEVIMGPFKGIQGQVKKKQSETRLVVWFDAIMQGISVEISPMYLKWKKQKSIDSVLLPLATNYKR